MGDKDKTEKKPLTVEDLDLEDESTEEDDDTEEEDQDAEDADDNDSEEDGDSDEDEDEEGADKKAHSNPKVEKRIATLTARMKKLETENSELVQEITFLDKELEKSQTRFDNRFPEPLKFDGKTLAEINEKEFTKALRNIRALEGYTAEQKEQLLELALEQREAGLPLQEAKQEITQKQNSKWIRDWNTVEGALTDPSLVGKKAAKVFKDSANDIKDHIQKQMNEKKFLRKALWEGGVDLKFEHAMKAIKALGLDKKAQIESYKDERPGVQSSTGKPGRKTPSSTPGKRNFTREEIDSMSLEEFEKHEKAIDAALKAKRIK